MENLREHKMSFWRHKTNEANRGYFPTALHIVKMEMDLIDFSDINETLTITMADLSGGICDQLAFMHKYIKDIGLMPISYYNEVTKERYNIANEKYGKMDNLHLLNADFFNLKVRNEHNQRAFTIIRNNPPYGWFDHNSKGTRLEDIFFTRNAEMNVVYGIQIFELPIHQLIEDKHLIRKIFYRYKDVSIFKFPDQEYDKKQICVIGKKKKQNSNDIELAEEWRNKLISLDIPSLDQVDKPVIKFDLRSLEETKPIEMFRDGKVTNKTLSRGFDSAFTDLVNESISSHTQDKSDLGLKVPMIEQLPGHIALDIYSGQYDGLIGDVLVKGGVRKEIIATIEHEEGKKTTTEHEVVYPFVEITSSNGKTLIKEHKAEN